MTTPNELAGFIEDGLRRGVREKRIAFLERRGIFWFSPIYGCALGLAAAGKMGARKALRAYRLKLALTRNQTQALSELIDTPIDLAAKVSGIHFDGTKALEIASKLRSGTL